MPARKRTKAASKAVGRPFAKGEDSRRNTTKPGPGRPPEEFKQLCRDMASGELTMDALQEILKDRTDTKFVAALRYVTEYGYGKVPDQVDVNQKVTHYIANVPAKGADPAAWQRTYSQK